MSSQGSQTQVITGEKPVKARHWSRMPQIADELLDLYAYRLFGHWNQRFFNTGGPFVETEQETIEALKSGGRRGMAIASMRAARKELVSKGFITVKPTGRALEITILDWTARNNEFCDRSKVIGLNDESDRSDRSEVIDQDPDQAAQAAASGGPLDSLDSRLYKYPNTKTIKSRGQIYRAVEWPAEDYRPLSQEQLNILRDKSTLKAKQAAELKLSDRLKSEAREAAKAAREAAKLAAKLAAKQPPIDKTLKDSVAEHYQGIPAAAANKRTGLIAAAIAAVWRNLRSLEALTADHYAAIGRSIPIFVDYYKENNPDLDLPTNAIKVEDYYTKFVVDFMRNPDKYKNKQTQPAGGVNARLNPANMVKAAANV